MENNPVKQRVLALTEQWRQIVAKLPDVRMFCWIGASTVDYKMIQGFIMYHMSEESKIEDTFLCFKHPFREEGLSSTYGSKIIEDAGAYISAWNADKELVVITGVIDWNPPKRSEKDRDEVYFAKYINLLAEKLPVNGKDQFLVIALFPQAVENFGRYAAWLASVIEAGISSKVRLMIYDNYDYGAFDGLSKQFPLLFHKIHTDLDMTGAMHQILENTKAAKTDRQERDAVSFQQLMIKITEAIGQRDKKKMDVYVKQSMELAQEHNWPHMAAMVHYFVHSWFVINNQQAEAHQALDHAVAKNDEAFDKKILVNEDLKYYYRVAKGNLYFMNKRFEEAAQVYKTCLKLNRSGIDKQLLLGIYQMLGTSLRHMGDKKNAWAFFVEGWEMIKDEPEESIKSNKLIQHYAKEMMEVAGNAENGFVRYYELFSKYWGKNWEKNITGDKPVLMSKRPSFF